MVQAQDERKLGRMKPQKDVGSSEGEQYESASDCTLILGQLEAAV